MLDRLLAETCACGCYKTSQHYCYDGLLRQPCYSVNVHELLEVYRRIMDHIHAGGNIFYDASRMAAYNTIAKLASEERREKAKA